MTFEKLLEFYILEILSTSPNELVREIYGTKQAEPCFRQMLAAILEENSSALS